MYYNEQQLVAWIMEQMGEKLKGDRTMQIKELMLEAVKRGELIEFLCGKEEYKIELSQYVPGVLPTDTGKVLADAIYVEYEEDTTIKEKFQNALLNMVNGTAEELYIAVAYIMDVLFDEKHKIATFQMDIAELVLELKKALKEKKEELMNEIIFTDGVVKKEAWKDIVRWDNVCKIKYGIEFIPRE